jgi:hypothetical protein
MPQRGFRIRMSEVPLHVFNGGVTLDVGGRSPPECLVSKIVDPNGLCEWFQVPLEIVSDAEGGSR